MLRCYMFMYVSYMIGRRIIRQIINKMEWLNKMVFVFISDGYRLFFDIIIKWWRARPKAYVKLS